MIKINLLPEEYRIVEETKEKPPILRIVLMVVGLALLVTLGLYIDYVISSTKLRNMEQAWKDNQPQYQHLTALKGDVEGSLKQEQNFMERFVVSKKPLTHLLQWVSEVLPETIWITEVTLTQEENVGRFLVRGISLPTPDQSSIEHIETYVQGLKEKMPDAELSLTTSRQKYEGNLLTQFVCEFLWGTE